MKKYNVGIIGYGWVATAHIPAINATAQAQVTAVYSSRQQNQRELSQKFGGHIDTYTDLELMLANPNIHAVSVCSMPSLHTQHVIAAAKAGKHIIIEKPLAMSWKDVQAMQAAVKKAGVKTCVCFECRWSSQFLATRGIIDQGLLGKLHYGEVDYYHGIGPWYGQFRWNTFKKDGGSSLLTAGCHALDALLLCMGSEVTEVTSYDTRSQSAIFKPYEYTTTSVTTHLGGSEGSLLDNKFHSMKVGGLNKHAWSTLSMKMLDSGDVSDHPYTTQFQAFFDALDKGKEMPLTSLDDAAASHKIIFAADKSAASGGKPVKV
jgi:predicted dehydrogenase